MDTPELEIAEWLASIADPELRRIVTEAFIIAADIDVADTDEEVFMPFVYPH